MAYDGEERRKRKLLDEGVSVADVISIAASIITAIGIGGPLLVWGGKMDARMASVETRQERAERGQATLDAKQDAERDQFKVEIRGEMREINQKLDRLIEGRTRR